MDGGVAIILANNNLFEAEIREIVDTRYYTLKFGVALTKFQNKIEKGKLIDPDENAF